MAKKDNSLDQLDEAWGFYLEDQKPAAVHQRCNAAGIVVHRNTISRWINKGAPGQEVEPFKKRLARIKRAAAALSAQRADNATAEDLSTAPRVTQAEIVGALADPRSDAALAVQLGSANLDQWRAQMDSQLLHATIANDKILESLMGVDPADPKAMKDVMTAWKNAVSAQRGIIESHSVLRGMGDPDALAPVGSDREIMEHFQGWTPEEYRLFRVEGIWPEGRGAAPDYILSPAPDDPDDPEDDE